MDFPAGKGLTSSILSSSSNGNTGVNSAAKSAERGGGLTRTV